MGKEMVSFKGTRNGLVIVLDPNREFDEIKLSLLNKMESAKGFFKGANFSLISGQNEMPAHQKDELENICQNYGLIPKKDNKILSDYGNVSRDRLIKDNPGLNLGEEAYLVQRSLRSGQRVYKPGHIIIMGDINHGAEAISNGSVLVMGTCRGVVHAGIHGDNSARVIAYRLTPTSLSIGGQRCTPEKLHAIPSGSQLARMTVENKIIFEKL